MTGFHSWWLNNIPLGIYTMFSLSTHLPLGLSNDCTPWLMWAG
jgi:hypothetical protein